MMKIKDDTIEKCFESVMEEKKRLLAVYHQAAKSLSNLELSKDDLINLFINFFPAHQRAPNQRERYLSNLGQGLKPVSLQLPKDSKAQTMNSFINKLSTWIASDQINADKFFEYVEELKTSKKAPTFKSKL